MYLPRRDNRAASQVFEIGDKTTAQIRRITSTDLMVEFPAMAHKVNAMEFYGIKKLQLCCSYIYIYIYKRFGSFGSCTSKKDVRVKVITEEPLARWASTKEDDKHLLRRF